MAATTSMNATSGPSGFMGTNVCHRANAIRALCKVTDVRSILVRKERITLRGIRGSLLRNNLNRF
jgi:hypothetical protein